MKKTDKLDRPEFLRKVAGVPMAAAMISLIAEPAEAADNKKQFKYQDKPGTGGKKCSQVPLLYCTARLQHRDGHDQSERLVHRLGKEVALRARS